MTDAIRLKVLIVDDEVNSRRVLKSLLESEFGNIDVVGEAADVEEAYTKVGLTSPDVVFLDIQMPKASGFSLLKKYESVPFEVIFVTSYDKYAISAIKFSALDYLLKPVEIPDLKQAIERAVKAVSAKENKNVLIFNLLQNIGDVPEKKVAVHVNDKVRIISEQQILYIESDRRYSYLYSSTKERFLTAKSLRDFEDYLGPDSSFVRINKSFLLNSAHILQYSKGDPFIIEMKDGRMFEVSRRKKSEVLDKLKKEL